MKPPGWQGILDDDEEIIWQGRPDGRIVLRAGNIFMILFGLAFAGFALVWMIIAASAGGFFWAFGLVHFGVGLSLAFGSLFFSAYRRRNTWYTLTSKRAFIATNLPIQGKRLKSFPITADTSLELEQGDPASIYFASEIQRGKNSNYQVRVGFERIRDGAEVFKKFRDVQENAA
ncbi:MAG: aspartate carbamoyltransferase catalytic subunit [Rhodobacteraceae bacterium]|nr:aspartate carbamoyltransferase catalytic subunit [Paracoccaceae bacterium]